MSGLPAQWCCFISPWLSSASYTATPALHNNSKQLGVVRSAVSEEAAPQVFFPPARSVYAKLTFNTSQVTENVVLFFLSLFRREGFFSCLNVGRDKKWIKERADFWNAFSCLRQRRYTRHFCFPKWRALVHTSHLHSGEVRRMRCLSTCGLYYPSSLRANAAAAQPVHCGAVLILST